MAQLYYKLIPCPGLQGFLSLYTRGQSPGVFVLKGAGKAQGAGKGAGKAQDRGSDIPAASLGVPEIIVYKLKFLFAWWSKLV